MKRRLHVVSVGQILYNIKQYYIILHNITHRNAGEYYPMWPNTTKYAWILHMTKWFDAALDEKNNVIDWNSMGWISLTPLAVSLKILLSLLNCTIDLNNKNMDQATEYSNSQFRSCVFSDARHGIMCTCSAYGWKWCCSKWHVVFRSM